MSRKFGTFGGVFTPSILTILGVIMYMRLPWIVGQAGLYLTLGIVLVAHIVSVTTGLSVSSIATDKKVKAGGTYYVISRSLGLPIGGTLGIALFFGLSFSVSLYLIGFSESLLSVGGFDLTTNNIRIAGTLALLGVTTLTFISTSLAIRAQFFIMAAIGLSLLSILFGNSHLAPAQPILDSITTMAPVMVLFGIFFPAVTGFEAGVSMSGDLKDAKKSIPGGTITAIIVGLVVYMGLTVFFAYRADSDSLVNNPNVLLDLSLYPPLVLAGIWGATLSSAIGSILGAPRILQATSADHITPRFFSRGVGKTNEPRNALLLTFVIAEAGILLGELNMIARVVSIFFITTYGFLNLSCAIENWASTDFRPSFRIPTLVSIIGTVTCFLIMLELDALAFAGASVLLGLLFLFLKRRELTLESGDTWGSVWSSVVRYALHRLSRDTVHQRNWRPNIVLFSGESGTRPHLVSFGEGIVKRRGMMSKFQLIENKEADVLFPKTEQTVKSDGSDDPGVFHRRQECRDIYEGMETIARVYGYSGLDPNTVLMGWGRTSKDPARFVDLLETLRDLDYNILLLDYDNERGFGKNQKIDIWWQPESQNSNFALTVLKFLTSGDEWRQASARILVVIDESALRNRVSKILLQVLEEHRVRAEVKIINNATQKLALGDIITVESRESDLTILGLPQFDGAKPEKYIADVTGVLNTIGTSILVGASSYFKGTDIGLRTKKGTGTESEQDEVTPLTSLILPADDMAAQAIEEFDRTTGTMLQEFLTASLRDVHESHRRLLDTLVGISEKQFEAVEKAMTNPKKHQRSKYVSRSKVEFLFNAKRVLESFQAEELPIQRDTLNSGIQQLLDRSQKHAKEQKQYVDVQLTGEKLQRSKDDSLTVRSKKILHRFSSRIAKGSSTHKVFLRPFYDWYFSQWVVQEAGAILFAEGKYSHEFISSIEKWIHHQWDTLSAIEADDSLGNTPARLNQVEKLHVVRTEVDKNLRQWNMSTMTRHRGVVNELGACVDRFDASSKIRQEYRIGSGAQEKRKALMDIPESWFQNQHLILNFAVLDCSLIALQDRLRTIIKKGEMEFRLLVEANLAKPLASAVSDLESLEEILRKGNGETPEWALSLKQRIDVSQVMRDVVRNIQHITSELPEELDLIAEESFRGIALKQFEDVETTTVKVRTLVESIVKRECLDHLQKYFVELSPRLHKCMEEADEAARLISFSLASSEAEEYVTTGDSREPMMRLVRQGQSRIETERGVLEEILAETESRMTGLSRAACDLLSPHSVIHSASGSTTFVRAEERLTALSRAREMWMIFRGSVQKKLVRAVYLASEGKILATRLGADRSIKPGHAEIFLQLIDTLAASPDVLEKLPAYYRQLFLGKQSIGDDFWVDRPVEMEKAKKAIRWYNQGRIGAVMVTGEPLSGKTALCQTMTRRLCAKQKVYQVFAPDTGSIEPKDLRSALQKETGLSGDFPSIFGGIQPGSVIILHDLELWWERSANGFAVVNTVMDLVNSYGRQCLFIINANAHSFRCLNAIQPIHDNFLATIECLPMDAEQIQAAVLVRHRSSDFSFELSGVSEEMLSEFAMAKFFSHVTDASGGNIGVALRRWISSVHKVREHTLMIGKREIPTENIFHEMDEGWDVYLLQLIVHKYLTLDRLSRIFHRSAQELRQSILLLERAGIVVEDDQGVMEINPSLRPLLINYYLERGQL